MSVQPFRIEQYTADRRCPPSGVKLYGFRLWDDGGVSATDARAVCVADMYPMPHPVAVNIENATRLAQLPILEASNAHMVAALAEFVDMCGPFADAGRSALRMVAAVAAGRAALAEAGR
ncbi:hypothetical protein [Sphingomonas sp. HMP6]|uniref:hypothetical protein n=1 Tax=Sphingomonas sp. HMP6 TaxID=1517551 RepID=UPI0015965FF0|nr:hypothetical protein [Sphingomonas sp. HMP6]BCA57701.1 hypothetical protein HMP06_0470 [Sphingomonas sp. HMP6]